MGSSERRRDLDDTLSQREELVDVFG